MVSDRYESCSYPGTVLSTFFSYHANNIVMETFKNNTDGNNKVLEIKAESWLLISGEPTESFDLLSKNHRKYGVVYQNGVHKNQSQMLHKYTKTIACTYILFFIVNVYVRLSVCIPFSFLNLHPHHFIWRSI